MKTNEYTMFRLSKPWGYYPPAVEEKIKQYEEALRNMNDKNQELTQVILSQQQNIEKLQEELREMHLEMSNLELPEIDDMIEHCVLDDFKNYLNEIPKNNTDNNSINFDYNQSQNTQENSINDEDIEFQIIT